MPSATLSLPPAPEHVRTARLVVVAAARRFGLDEELVDDVRLAVGEAVARAVLRSASAGVDSAVDVIVREESDRFEIEVREAVDPSLPEVDGGVALALIAALAPYLSVAGGVLTLAWPSGADVP